MDAGEDARAPREAAPDLQAQEKHRSSPYATQVCDNLLPIMGSLRFRRKPLIGKYCSFTF